MTERLAQWFIDIFANKLGGEMTAFITSVMPVLECRGGMIVAKIFDIPFIKAFLICYLGNMIPMPFILLFIRKILEFMKKHNILKKFIEKMEGRADKNRDKIMRYKQWGLLLFIAIPLPGTGGWTGSLFAALLDIDFKKALPIVALGVFIADLIMSVLTYGVGAIFA
ncbi:MAG: small multi-drug export protein [Oscillospiraceae bacterium]|nr:small multi-drug export protein [Oscillospiraceae bacterium]